MSNSAEMHEKALRDAIKKGPRVFLVHGEERVAYGLRKDEIRALFLNNGYNISTGRRWRSTLLEWTDHAMMNYDLVTAKADDVLDKRKDVDFSVLFCDLNKSQMMDLTLDAEDKQIRSWPTREMWEDVFCAN